MNAGCIEKIQILGFDDQVGGLDIGDASFIHVAWSDQAIGYQVAQPLRRAGVDLVVVSRHARIVLSRMSLAESDAGAYIVAFLLAA